jgi:hypothetical protein
MEYRYVKFAEAFSSRKYLRKKIKIEFREDKDRPRLFCDSPQIVARYASELRQVVAKNKGTERTITLIRGQARNHRGMVPGLFRNTSDGANPQTLKNAEEKFIQCFRDRIKLGRFKRDPLAALLQHYGFNTSWIDLVDNLWVAVWFASHIIEAGKANQRNSGTGWLYFLSAEHHSDYTTVVDVRNEHHGLSLRPHTQHGWSLRGRNETLRDLESQVVGVVEFPISETWTLAGSLFSNGFLFPNKYLDNTLKALIKHKADDIASEVERSFGIAENALGRIQEIK